MTLKNRIMALLLLLLPPAAMPARAAPPPQQERWFYGGGLALSFGSVDFVSITPYVGYRITPVVSAGVGLQYAYRDDSRYGQSFSSSDYGGSIFSRVYLDKGIFLSAAYEYLRFEYLDASAVEVSDDYSSVFVGGGLARPLGPNASFVVSAMYNLSYESTEPSPYDSPWVIGAGVGVGF
jgi:hypothetical protein